MLVSILICSFKESNHLYKTLSSINDTFPSKYEREILTDIEEKRTGISNTPKRYMNLFKKSRGDIIVKSDDDVMYYLNWFDLCLDVLNNYKNIGYVGPISHELMKQMKIRHAFNNFPIIPNGIRYEPVASGMCWVFYRKLWNEIPYNDLKTFNLDGEYANRVNKKGYKIAVLNGALISHLGQDRYKGISTDIPGRLPSNDFRKNNPHQVYRPC